MVAQRLLVSMGAIETNANTKAILSTRVDGNRARAAKDLSSHLECDGTEE